MRGVQKTEAMEHSHYECIKSCIECMTVCRQCAKACLREENLEELARCIQLDMECAGMCSAAAEQMSFESDQHKELCRLCAEACDACAAECEKHTHDHCRECAEACRRCAEECRKMF